ncbi:MAG TPA: phytanoyl-CoA dioxygenase family protein, partial [Gemmataceae bacterium]
MTDRLLCDLNRDGFAVLPGVFPPAEVAALRDGLTEALAANGDAAPIRSSGGSVYAARNVLDLYPAAADAADRPPLPAALAAVLGPGYGLVRVLFFDKPPDRTWALPWHKDVTVAVRDNRRPGAAFTLPTCKAGVPHAEAPAAVLERMLTARVHLDDVTDENGPLRVLPGSHRTGKELRCDGFAPHAVLAAAGDVLLMRPLLAHASGCSRPGTRLHRRILHLEFAAAGELPDGYEWHTFRGSR